MPPDKLASVINAVESDSKRYLALYDLETKESERLKEICNENGIDYERR